MNATKEHILKTSLILFLRKSYKEVTMSDIVKATGLSKGAFYHYFSSKEELFREITCLFIDSGTVDYSVFPKESFKSFYTKYIQCIEESMEALSNLTAETELSKGSFNVFLILFEAVSRFPEFMQKELEMHQRDMLFWEEEIARARESGEINPTPSDRRIASLFLYCSDGAFIRFLNDTGNRTLGQYLLDAFDALYDTIKT